LHFLGSFSRSEARYFSQHRKDAPVRSNSDYHPCNYEKACNIKWAVDVMGWSQTRTAIEFDLNVGTVNHVVRKKRFPDAVPKPPAKRA
jgi:hypothetical protein